MAWKIPEWLSLAGRHVDRIHALHCPHHPSSRGCVVGAMSRHSPGFLWLLLCLSASGKPRVASEGHDRLFQSKQDSIVICQNKFCNKQNKTKTGSKSRPGQALFCHSRDLLLGTPGPNKDKMVLQLLLNCCDRTP